MSDKRGDTSAAVAGLFDRLSATGGLAGRDAPAAPDGRRDARLEPSVPASARAGVAATAAARVRLGVELSEEQIAYLRGLSRPARTGGPRTLGSKFIATGVLGAAIELLEATHVDMRGVAAGDVAELTARARAALIRAAATASKEPA